MTRQEKDQFIDQLAEKLDANKNIYLTDISGLTVDTSNKLRRLCFSKGVQLEVVKNTLLKQAMEKVETNFEESYDLLVGNTALMYSASPSLPAQVIKEFRKKNDKPILKGAYIDSSFYLGDEQVKELAALKSKDELIGEIISLLQSPAKNVISALQSGGNKLTGILKTLGDRPDVSDEASAKSEDAVTEAPAETATEAPATTTKENSNEADASSETSIETKESAEAEEESTDTGETSEATGEATEEAGAEETSEESSDESNKESTEAKAEEEASNEATEEESSEEDESSDDSTDAKAEEDTSTDGEEEKKD